MSKLTKSEQRTAHAAYGLAVGVERAKAGDLNKVVKDVAERLGKFLDAHTSTLRQCGEGTPKVLKAMQAKLLQASINWENPHGPR